MSGHHRVLVVGASVGGAATVEALRRRGYAGQVTLFGAEPHPPYGRPPLSKQILSGAWQAHRAQLRPPDLAPALCLSRRLTRPSAAA